MSLLFEQYENVPELFIGQQSEEDTGWVAVVLPGGKKAEGKTISLETAYKDTNLNASFVFSPLSPEIKSGKDAELLVTLINKTIRKRGAYRGIVWLPQITFSKNDDSTTWPSLCLNFSASQVSYALSKNIGTGLAFTLDNGMLTSLEGDKIKFNNKPNGTNHIHFDGPSAPPQQVSSGSLSFTGEERGCISFNISIESSFIVDTWSWGMQFQIPWTDNKGNATILAEWAPFIDISGSNNKLELNCKFDPGDIFNRKLFRRTILKITGQDESVNASDKTKSGKSLLFNSYYRTAVGGKVVLQPVTTGMAETGDQVAGFTFAEGKSLGKNKLNIYVSPVGDYIVSAPTAPESKRTQILCGLQGSEYIALFPASNEYVGDRLRYIGSQSSYGYCYPLPQASPVGPPVDPTQKLLNDSYITSWVTAVKAPGTIKKEYAANPVYVAQPKGTPLFGQDPVINHNYKNLLGNMHPGTEIEDEKIVFPMLPYAGVAPGENKFTFNGELISLFERQYISPTRRTQIGTGTTVSSALDHISFIKNEATDFNVTTPAGQLVTIDSNGTWLKILLARITHPQLSQLYFENPGPKLIEAFQTADPMLVIANPEYLGDMGGDESADFNNTLNIENWVLAAQVGDNYSYGNYTNVIIVKGVKGKLFNPNDRSDCLVANPAKWTQKKDFGAPNGKTDELIPLSQWMLDYFKDALEKADSDSNPDKLYFEKFNSIVQDENWAGILILKVNIAGLPEQMKGITAGIEDPSQFYAHHLAIEIGQIVHDDEGVRLKDSTSVYGLIYYCDPSYNASKPGEPVPPDAGSIYDFRLLTLKVLFENSALKHFQSYAQLTLNQLFGSNVKEMGPGGNMYNSIILRGTFQENDGAPVYGLGSIQDYTFFMDSNVYNKIEITSAQMTTRRATDKVTNIWFGMTGYLDFVTLSTGGDDGSDPMLIDLFSFGSVDGKTQRQGLHFSNLGLQMNYPTMKPMNRIFLFDSDEIRFDIASSNIRENSLYRSFALELDGLINGEGEDNTPAKKGYLTMITDLRLSGVGDKKWNGLKFRLNLGTPGELAGKIGLNSDLLLAWSPLKSEQNNYNILAGLHMPGTSNGASILSLQGVLKLSWGPLRLIYAKDPNSKTGRRFMLLMTDIALKFLGLLKIPPNAAISFYLFGNPKNEGKSSGLGWYTTYILDSVKKK